MEERTRDMTFEEAEEYIAEHRWAIHDLYMTQDLIARFLLHTYVMYKEAEDEETQNIDKLLVERAVKLFKQKQPDLMTFDEAWAWLKEVEDNIVMWIMENDEQTIEVMKALTDYAITTDEKKLRELQSKIAYVVYKLRELHKGATNELS